MHYSMKQVLASRRCLISTKGIHQILVLGAFACFLVNQFRGHAVTVREGHGREMRIELQTQPSGVDLGYYRSLEELQERSLRFPSVEERLKVYMSTWYVPPCPDNKKGMVQYNYVPKKNGELPLPTAVVREVIGTDNAEQHTIALETSIEHSRKIFFLDRSLMTNCKDKFCIDTVKYFFPALDRVGSGHTEDNLPIIMQFGDADQYRAYAPALGKEMAWPMVPVIKKFRYSMETKELERVTSQQCYSGPRELASTARDPRPRGQAIVSIVSNYERHFEPLVQVRAVDTVWEQKRNAAVWRGALTGRNRAGKASSELEWCQKVQRCNFVLKHGRSTLVDARLVIVKKGKQPISETLQDVEMYGDSLSMEELLKYKAIVMLEGNDVSTGLKWALFSESVVMTITPTCTSWAMEELLEPWVHYIPLADDFSDVEEKVQWVIDNDNAAREIAQRGRLWISDLVFHPDSKKDNELVLEETFRRYKAHFTQNPTLILNETESTTISR
jgi:Glycosyl transferase family 90